MQGKTCFNFKTDPEPELIAALTRLTEAAFQQWREKSGCEPPCQKPACTPGKPSKSYD